MGNKIETDKKNCIFNSPLNNSASKNKNNTIRTRSAQKDGLYSEERLFENFDSKNYFNYKTILLIIRQQYYRNET